MSGILSSQTSSVARSRAITKNIALSISEPSLAEWFGHSGRYSTSEDCAAPRSHAELPYVVSGGIGIFVDHDRPCVSWYGSGSRISVSTPSPDGRSMQTLGRTEILEGPSGQTALNDPAPDRAIRAAREHSLFQVEREAACLAAHSVMQRVARWLLRLAPATERVPFLITQERLAQILGVQRTSVNAALQCLQTRKIVQSRRGKIVVIDAAGLKRSACLCDQDGAS